MEHKTENRPVAIQLSGVKKIYKLGQIGGGTLTADLQSWWARVRGKEDPNAKIGMDQRLIGKTFMALNGIDLTVYQGEALGIIGGNGAGKSTMLKLLSRVTAPTEGEIDIYGRIASMLEVGTGFNGEMTGRENIYMNGAILGMTKAEIDAKMEDIIEFSEVREFIDTPVKRYSSGMYVKLAFSVAAHLDSEIMIMDEVLAVGDMAFQKKCLDKMRNAAKKEGRTVLYVSHNMNTIRKLCDRCIVLDKGKVIFNGSVDEAISIYNGVIYLQEYDYTYTDSHHSKNLNAEFRFMSLSYTNDNRHIHSCGEPIRFDMKAISTKAFSGVYFRFEVQNYDGNVIGTMFSGLPVTIPCNDIVNMRFEIDTEHLAPGRYRVDIIAYQKDEFQKEHFLDGIYPGLFIELKSKPSDINWIPKYWGAIHLHDVTVTIPKGNANY